MDTELDQIASSRSFHSEHFDPDEVLRSPTGLSLKFRELAAAALSDSPQQRPSAQELYLEARQCYLTLCDQRRGASMYYGDFDDDKRTTVGSVV